jgi:TonB family protein
MELGKENNKNFTIILCMILLAHAVFLVIKKIETSSEFLANSEDEIKIKFIPNPEILNATTKTKTFASPKQQIVQTDQTGENKKPTKEAFLGESNQSFDRETMAANIDIFNQAGIGKRNGSKTKSLDKNADTQAQTKKKEVKLSDLGLGKAEPFENYKKEKAAALNELGLENGNQKSRGLSSTNDYIEHKKLGDFTQLNTVEFKYYGFYHRIRQKLEQFWGQTLQEKADKIFRSGRKIASDENHITGLMVTLNNKGEIVHVKVKAASGLKELDDAAIESFNKAGPFPNPPTGMLTNGYATIEWGFVVQS